MVGFERLYKDGMLGVVHGCGYDHPSLSHFSSMGFWHTGVPNGGEPLGWLGRLADKTYDTKTRNVIVNLGNSQSLAVRSAQHSPLVFDDPARFRREGTDDEKQALAGAEPAADDDERDARVPRVDGAERDRELRLRAPGVRRLSHAGGLRRRRRPRRQPAARRVAHRGRDADAALLRHLQGNSFDTHVQQADLHSRLLMYTADAVRGFIEDIKRIGRADEVAVMIFTEFGRRVEENGSLGTDHGTATPMFVIGKGVKGGFYGKHPSLTDLDDGNLKMTTDFRRVYATMIKEWLGYDDTATVLKGRFEPLGVFAPG